MKFRDFSSKLATRLRAGQHFKQQKHDARPTQFSDLEAMVSAMQSQDDAALLRVPREIRDIIFDHLWNDAGLAQHIVFQNGHYSAAKCLTAHSVPDNSLAEESASHGTSRFEDVVLWRRMTSSWGNHWRCEEFSHAGRSEQRQINDAGSSLFLTLLLVCRQMYAECRAAICSKVTFVIHDIETLYQFTIHNQLPIFGDIKFLNLAVRLPIRNGAKKKMDREAEATMARWRACCEALDRAQSLVSVDLWLDTTEPVWRGLLSFVPGDNANPFVFPEKLAAKLTVDLPVNPDRPEVWKDVAAIEPAFSIRARGWPAFRAEIPDTPATTTTPPHSIIKLWESAEPGALRTPLIFGTHHAHPIRR